MSKDTIYRQDAIDAVADGLKRVFVENRDVAEILLKSVPSAQPEIVRCKDCKDWHPFADKLFGYCRREYWDDDGHYRLKVETNHDDYCSFAERKEDE